MDFSNFLRVTIQVRNKMSVYLTHRPLYKLIHPQMTIFTLILKKILRYFSVYFLGKSIVCGNKNT